MDEKYLGIQIFRFYIKVSCSKTMAYAYSLTHCSAHGARQSEYSSVLMFQQPSDYERLHPITNLYMKDMLQDRPQEQ